MRKSTRLLAIFLAVLMTVSVLPVSVFAADNVITAVDMTGFVTETVFPYNPGSGDAYWSTYASNVTNPTFYPTIPATVDGLETDLPVTWVSNDYKSNAPGTYTFTAVAEGYTWECSAPTISVKVVDAGMIVATRRYGFSSSSDCIIGFVVDNNKFYDATGCNVIVQSDGADYSVPTKSNSYRITAGQNSRSGTGKTAYSGLSTGDLKLVVKNTTVDIVHGGGHGISHADKTYTYVSDSTIGTVFAGGYASDVQGDSYVDVSGKVTIGTINGANYNNSSATGVTTVNIHNLKKGSEIDSIVRGTATKLVVNLDETSKHLVSVVATDSATEININGERYVGTVTAPAVTDIPESIVKGSASTALPTTFGSLSGFAWSGNDTVAGDVVFTLTAPTGYFFDGLVKTKTYTITVYNELVDASAVVIDQGDVTLSAGSTTVLTATVEPDNASNKTVTWSTQDTGIIEIDAVTGEVTALAVGVATVTAMVGTVSDTCTVTVEQAVKITDVDTEGLALYTVFPYNDVDAQGKWSIYASYVESPVFYPTLSVLIEGQSDYTDLPVTWVCTDENGEEVEYNGKATGSTYYFRAVAEGYTFTSGAPVITAEIADAGLFTQTTRNFGYSSVGNQIPIVVKINNDKDCVLYDATGLNVIAMSDGEAYAIPTMSKSNLYHIYAGLGNKNGTGKTANINPEGDTSITLLDVARLETLYGGGYKVAVDGSTNITIKNSTITTVYGGGNGADVANDANIDISGKVNITSIYGGGSGSDVSGVATITIHELEEGSLIGKIYKGTASAMVIDVDDPEVAVEIFKAVDDWTNVTAKVNGQEVKVITSLDVTKTEYSVVHGTPLANVGLPTSFEVGGSVVDGFTWDGEYNATRAGTYALTLVPPADVYLTVEIAVTVTVEAKVASYKISSISTPTANVDVAYKTSLEDAKAQLPTEFVANDGAFTVPSSAYEWTTEEYNSTMPGEYTFTAEITNDDYIYLEGVEAFKAVVTVGVPTGEETVVTEIDLPVNYTVFTKDTGTVTVRDSAGNASNETRPVKFYDKLNAVAYENGVRKDIEITGIEWEGELSRTMHTANIGRIQLSRMTVTLKLHLS